MQHPVNDWRNALDVGCGTGLSTTPFADKLLQLNKNVKIIAIDNSETQVDEARVKNARQNVEYR
jgi:2-polyprenyl-3-methyl-5-hydroxy-6-metoxy-1,4-benzoquinol methylase